jgi:hypothetical protein
MDQAYWIGRKRFAMKMARGAATAEARLIHYDLAGRYSVAAARFPAFIVPASSPPAADDRPALHLPQLEVPPPARHSPGLTGGRS